MADKDNKKSSSKDNADNFDVTEDCMLLREVLASLGPYKAQKKARDESIRQYVSLIRQIYTSFIDEGFSDREALNLTKHTVEVFFPQEVQ